MGAQTRKLALQLTPQAQIRMENRRKFLKQSFLSLLSACAIPSWASSGLGNYFFFDISLAQWSLHRSLFSGKLSNMRFPEKAKREFGIDIVEYVSVFFKGNETDSLYVKELQKRTTDLGVKNHLIMVDAEGNLASNNKDERKQAIENHYKWVEVAEILNCDSIRVNASGVGHPKDTSTAAADSLSTLADFSKEYNINIIVENHGGLSSNANWLAQVIKSTNSPFCGTLPDFGNFKISESEFYDPYKGVAELVPFAKGISAKTFDFDANGYETSIDYFRMFDIIKKSGWTGVVGIEYEGHGLSEEEGVIATKKLLERIRNHQYPN